MIYYLLILKKKWVVADRPVWQRSSVPCREDLPWSQTTTPIEKQDPASTWDTWRPWVATDTVHPGHLHLDLPSRKPRPRQSHRLSQKDTTHSYETIREPSINSFINAAKTRQEYEVESKTCKHRLSERACKNNMSYITVSGSSSTRRPPAK